MERPGKTRLRMAGIAVAAAAATCAPPMSGLPRLEGVSFDLRTRACADPARADPRIVICAIDQESLDELKKINLDWPWPREVLAGIVGFFLDSGASAVAIDLMLDDASKWREDDDPVLAETIARRPVFLAVPFTTGAREGFDEGPLRRFAIPEDPARGRGPKYAAAIPPLDLFLEAAGGIGNVMTDLETDGKMRTYPPTARLGERTYPSLAWSLALHAGGATAPPPAVNADGRCALRFLGPARTYRRIPALNVFQSRMRQAEGLPPLVDPATLRDAIVLLGATAPGLRDVRPSPTDVNYSGVEVHATALDNFLHGDVLRDRSRGAGWRWCLSLAASLAATWAGARRRIATSVGSWLGIAGLAVVGSLAAFRAGWWLPLAAPLTSLTIAYATSTALHFVTESRRRQGIERAFGQYLHPVLVKRLQETPELLRLGGEEREMTALFSDIEGFTSVAEHLSAAGTVSLMNEYLDEMSEVILRHHGTLDKYVGDGIVAFWGAPVDQEDHAARACAAALDCAGRLREMQPSLKARGLPALRARIGLNSGRMVVGNMGSRAKFNYTVYGDAVNLASRLEGAAKRYGNAILAGEGTVRAAGSAVLTRELDLLKVVGRQTPERVYEIVALNADADPAARTLRETFARGLAAFRARDWDAAEVAFRDALRVRQDDPPSLLYLDRIGRYRTNPPPEGWDGVHALDSK